GWVRIAILIARSLALIMRPGRSRPAALARPLSVRSELTGSAAGLYALTQRAMCAVGTTLVGYGSNPAFACAVVQILLLVVTLLAFRIAVAAPRKPRGPSGP